MNATLISGNLFNDLSWMSGIVQMPWWGYALVALLLTHITIASVTIFLHRHQAHRSVELHPLASHFFRFWLWLTTGMVTKEWTAVHRKHHAYCEKPEDPHSPRVYGIRKVLWQGVELYRVAAADPATLERFGRGTPDDKIERRFYTPHSKLGIGLLLVVNLVLFGPLGLTIWAIQMLWVPFFAAGVVNGVGHYWGYRNFESSDTSTNISPWGILIGGEELHNNHHAFPASAKLSAKWYEFDIGWVYIRCLQVLGLARVKKVIPKCTFDLSKTKPDMASLQSIFTHRYTVLLEYAKTMGAFGREELTRLQRSDAGFASKSAKEWRRLLWKDEARLAAQERSDIEKLLSASPNLHTLYDFYRTLQRLWAPSNAPQDELLVQLQAWCAQARASGIAPLESFSRYLTRFA